MQVCAALTQSSRATRGRRMDDIIRLREHRERSRADIASATRYPDAYTLTSTLTSSASPFTFPNS